MYLRPVLRSLDQRCTAVWYSTKNDASSSVSEEVLAWPYPTNFVQACSPHACHISSLVSTPGSVHQFIHATHKVDMINVNVAR